MAEPKAAGQYHHGDLSRALLDEAIALTTEHGLEGWTLAAAARRLGVSSGAPYRHYKNKSELLDAVAQDGLVHVREVVRAAAEHPGPLREQFTRMIQGLVRFAYRNPTLYQITFGGVRRDTVERLERAAGESAFGTLRQAVQAWCDQGWLRSRDTTELAILIWAHGHGMASLVASRRLDVSERRALAMARRHAEAFLDGLGVQAGA